jgi:hypothetical protein
VVDFVRGEWVGGEEEVSNSVIKYVVCDRVAIYLSVKGDKYVICDRVINMLPVIG